MKTTLRKGFCVAAGAALAMVGLAAASPVMAQTSLRLDYEDGTKTSGTGVEFNECCQHSINVDDLPRTGDYAIRHHLRYGDPMQAGGTRAETHTLHVDDSHFHSGDTVFYGFSIYIPSTWERDSREDIVFQWKPWRDACEADKYPSAFLTVQASGMWRLRVNSDGNRCSTPDSVQKTSFDLAEVKPGQWHDFVFKFEWSHTRDGRIDGWYQTHKSPGWTKVVNAAGPNTFNDDDTTDGYLKWGIYKPAWNDGPTDVESRVIFHDNVAVGTTFREVNPAVR